jgi:hypothetical protein
MSFDVPPWEPDPRGRPARRPNGDWGGPSDPRSRDRSWDTRRLEADPSDPEPNFVDRDHDSVDDRLAAAEQRRGAGGGQRIAGRNNLLASDERVLVRVRHHPLLIVGQLIGALVAVVVGLLLAWAGPVLVGPHVNEQAGLAVAGLGLLVALFGLVSLWWRTLVWRRMLYLVTDRRLIRLWGVFNFHEADTALEKVNDTSQNQSVLGRLLDYGDLDVLTAADAPPDRFSMMAHFNEFVAALHEARRSYSAGYWNR